MAFCLCPGLRSRSRTPVYKTERQAKIDYTQYQPEQQTCKWQRNASVACNNNIGKNFTTSRKNVPTPDPRVQFHADFGEIG